MLRHSPLPQARRGVALIIALAVMVLVTALVVGFLTRVTTERGASSSYASAVNARLLAETSVQIVQAQIDGATRQGNQIAWASQPGLIRTYDSTGAPAKSYKLYSSDAMQVAGALDPAAEAAVLADWNGSPALYTDINMPLDTDFDGSSDLWPILNPAADGVVEGFRIIKEACPIGKYVGVTNPAPMPVRWLYVLQDGQVAAPSGSAGAAIVAGATASNPIVGRIAFWTDDETCKVNVNTASEGTYWDIPRSDNPTERALGTYQPARNEFQAYPGHPGTTSLSALGMGLTRDQILELVPRLQKGGSDNGTVPVNSTTKVALDQDRLYATESELLFSKKLSADERQPNGGVDKSILERSKFFLSTTSRAPETNVFNLPKIACWPIHATNSTDYRSSFDRLIAFCSTINQQPYYFQRKNADSSTKDYDEIPRNQTLFKYLRKLTGRAVPGFGGTLEGKYQDDRDQILTEIFDYIRCTNLSDGNLSITKRYAQGKQENGSSGGYIGYGQVLPLEINDSSTGIDARGFGRYPAITEVGLWLICTGDAKNAASNDPVVNKTLYPADASGALTANDAPASGPKTKQIRVEGALVFELFVPLQGYRGIVPDLEVTISNLENWKIRGNAPGDMDRNLGFPSITELTHDGKGRYLLSTNPVSTVGTGMLPVAGHIGVWAALGSRGLRARNHGRLAEDTDFRKPFGGNGSILNQQYPFVGEPVTVNVQQTSPKVAVTAGSVGIQILQRSTGYVLQTLKLDFPNGEFPAPTLRSNPADKAWTFQAGGAIDGSKGRFDDPSGFTFQTYDSTGANCDVVKSIVPTYEKGGNKYSADLRRLTMQKSITAGQFSKHPLFDETGTLWKVANSFVQQSQGWYYLFRRRVSEYPTAVAALGGSATNLAKMTQSYDQQTHPDTPFRADDAQDSGDWDNGMVNSIDGPYLNKADEGVTYTQGGIRVPYYETYAKEDYDSANFFSPNRMIPSPGMLGSLPTGVKRGGRDWQTLLFRRQPGHPNYNAPAGQFTKDPDYLFLDFFWMPVVEPYAISEPFSTAGKINLNQQIIPFTYLERNTGLHAVLKNEKAISIPNTEASIYKKSGNTSASSNYRLSINIPHTLEQLRFRFENTDGSNLYAFRSAAEICDMHLIPSDAAAATSGKQAMDQSMKSYWENHALTGDNSRERVYTTVYPRLTTKSNTYTVYFRAQSLKQKPRGTDRDKWFEGRDGITGEYRGSITLERYIDPNNSGIPDYASNPDATPGLESFYRWRMRNHRQFSP